MAHLLLQPGMRVVPIGAALWDRELIGERLAGADPRKGDARHAIHLERPQKPVPVDGGVLFQHIPDSERNLIALAEADEGTRQGPVGRDRVTGSAANFNGDVADRQIELGPGKLEYALIAGGSAPRPGGQQRACAKNEAAAGARLQHVSSRQHLIAPKY